MNIFVSTVYWAVLISLGSYILCRYIQNKTQIIILNPLLVSTVVTIGFLLLFNVDYDTYYEKVDILHYILSPATVCLAIPLYEQVVVLKNNLKAILLGILSGVLASMISILAFSIIFDYSHEMYVTLLPKSVTAAIAMGISEELGGVSSLTVPIVIMTGITGHMIAEKVCKIFRITEPIAKGVAIGTASHAMGTSKAMEMGDVEGAMSSLSMAVAGVMTVVTSVIFSLL